MSSILIDGLGFAFFATGLCCVLKKKLHTRKNSSYWYPLLDRLNMDVEMGDINNQCRQSTADNKEDITGL